MSYYNGYNGYYNEHFESDDHRPQSLNLTAVTPPVDTILSLALAKNHLRVRHTHEDAEITDLVEEGTQWLERRTGRSLRPVTLRLSMARLPDRQPIILAAGPVQSIDAITYIDHDGNPQAYETANTTTGMPGIVKASSSDGWPSDLSEDHPAAFSIDYTAGYPVGECPANLVRALKLWIDLEYHEHEEANAGRIQKRIDAITHSYCVKDNSHAGLRT